MAMAVAIAWLVEVAAIQNALGKQVIVRCFVVVPDLDGKAISSFLSRKHGWMLKKHVVLVYFRNDQRTTK